MLITIYRNIIPLALRNFIYYAFLGQILYFFRNFNIIAKSKFVFLFQWIFPKTDENIALAFMGRHGLTSYPYPYMLEYKKREIIVEFDISVNLLYVIHNNKRLFFPKSYSKEKVIKDYKSLLIEQDYRAAHRYVESYHELEGKTLFDIGSAEGIFALDTIEFVKHVYLFECEESWLAPLEATFAPWNKKVTLVKKYVSDKTDEKNITLDDFMKDKICDNLFFKMDIEGAEIAALNGAINILKRGKNIDLSVCTYHRINDAENISKLLSSIGYSYEFTKGLMFWNKRFSKNIIRCKKNQ